VSDLDMAEFILEPSNLASGRNINIMVRAHYNQVFGGCTGICKVEVEQFFSLRLDWHEVRSTRHDLYVEILG